MSAKYKKKLEDAKKRVETDNFNSFFSKIKSNRHEPLPDPYRFRWGGVFNFFLFIIFAGGVCFGAYYFWEEGQNRRLFQPQDTGEEDVALSIKKGEENRGNDFFVEVKSEVSIGSSVSISYALPDYVNDESKTELHLVGGTGEYIGYIADVDFNDSSFEWDPKILREDGASSRVKAPEEGQYFVMLAAREGGDERPLSELDDVVLSKELRIIYDALLFDGEVPFSSCFEVGEYKSIGWYDSFAISLEDRGLEAGDVDVLCYSHAGGIVVFIVNERLESGYPKVFRFKVKDEESGTGPSLREAVYVEQIDSPLQVNSATFGRREGLFIPVIVNGRAVFSYDFSRNELQSII